MGSPGNVGRSSAISLDLPALLTHRHVALNVASAACKVVAARVKRCAPHDFEEQVVSALGEAFNNTVLHAYAGRSDGRVMIEIVTSSNELGLYVIDNGASFDISAVRDPMLDDARESGMGVFIMRAFMDVVTYRSGPPNVLSLRKLF